MTNPLKKIKQWRETVIDNIVDKEKIANRIPGDGLQVFGSTPGTTGILSALKHYITGSNTDVEDRIKSAMKNVAVGINTRDELEQIIAHEDAKRVYLGLPQLYNSLEKSPYQATIGTVSNPYQINHLLSDEQFNNLIVPLWGAWKTGKDWNVYGTTGRVNDLGKTAQLHDIPTLQDAGLSIGMDNKGQYLSLYDIWDYNSKKKNKWGDNIGKWIGGKPFNIYQRYYLDDWLDIPEDARGNPYIAPAYIEAKINPDR